ncbi:MAG: SIS domain-containing protein, partial [Gemmatimonadota bacterium]|nr:SIS domain-containing protein [Gemmatimonadota bacterium]
MTTGFITEVDEQPQALKDLISFYEKDGATLLAGWREVLDRHSNIVFCGMGTSEFAPGTVQGLLIKQGKSVSIYDAGEYLHYLLEARPAGSRSLFVLISQSGESVETKKVAQALSGKAATVVLTNDESSSMARAADLCLPLRAGREAAITNKTYLNTLGLLYLMAGGRSAPLEAVAASLASASPVDRAAGAARHIQPADSIHCVARGPALTAARQLALTFMEGARVHATAFSGGAFRHGPFETIGQGHRAVFLIPQGKTAGLCFGMLEEMLALGSRVVLLTDCKCELENEDLYTIELPAPGEERLFPLVLARVQCHFLHHVAA